MKASENDPVKRIIALLVPIALTLVGAHPASSRTQPAALDHVTVAGPLTGVPPTGRQAPQPIAQSKSRLRGYLMP